MFRDAIITKPRHFDFLSRVCPSSRLCTSLDEIAGGGDHLLTFGTGVIVPASTIKLWKWAYNIHAAPPSYPGRDPHHWAAYYGAKAYGATAHVLAARVDEGSIVATLTFGVPKDCTPQMFMDYGEAAARALLTSIAPLMFGCGVAPNGETWNGTKRRRNDVFDLLSTPCTGELETFRRQAFDSFRA